MKETFKSVCKGIFFSFFIFLVSISQKVVFAQTSGPGTGGTTGPGTGSGTGGSFPNPIRYSTFMDFVKAILEVVLKIGIPVAAMFIIYSGFLFVKAQGNPEELKRAKSAFTYAVIGTAILLGSWLLATGIESTINSLQP